MILTLLPHYVPISSSQVERYATTVLSALMSGLEDKEDVDDLMTLASMSGLAAVLAEIEEPHVRAILINITLNIRLGFQKVGTGRWFRCLVHAPCHSSNHDCVALNLCTKIHA